jgi:methyl-accepting chemotaxis protein
VTGSALPAITTLAAAITVAALALAWRVRRRDAPRQRAFTRLLDAADALEARLRTAKAEIEAITGDEDESVRSALQEMLRQRLWLQQHGETASIQTLNELRASIDQARARIDQQLIQIERARAAAP